MVTNPNAAAFMPYPKWTYPARVLWQLVQATIWRLAWKRIRVLRPAILKAFGASMPFQCLICSGVTVYFPWELSIGKHVAISDDVTFYNLGGMTLGDRVVVSQHVYFCGGTHVGADHGSGGARQRLCIDKIVVRDHAPGDGQLELLGRDQGAVCGNEPDGVSARSARRGASEKRSRSIDVIDERNTRRE